MSRDLRNVLRIVWLIVTFITTAAILAPFVLGEQTIAKILPVCEARRNGSACWFCGTTTGFIAIAQGDWRGAARANRIALPLFAVFTLNAGIAVVQVTRRFTA